MYNMDYEIAQKAFLGKGKIDHVTEGTYEIIGKVNLNINNLEERIQNNKDNVAVFSFWGDIENDPLKRINEIVEIQQNVQTEQEKECNIVTVAPVKEWQENEQLLCVFDCINIKRIDIDDEKNNKMLGCETLTKAMYKNITDKVKEKITLVIDCDKAQIVELNAMVEFFEFAKEIGINKIMFVSEKTIIQHKNNLSIEAESKRMQQAIQKLRRGEKLTRGMIEPIPVKFKEPLFGAMRSELIQAGWNFDILKVASQDNAFFYKLTLNKGQMSIILKQGVEDAKLKMDMWQNSRSRKYIVKV